MTTNHVSTTKRHFYPTNMSIVDWLLLSKLRFGSWLMKKVKIGESVQEEKQTKIDWAAAISGMLGSLK
jgi:hypothetical protein